MDKQKIPEMLLHVILELLQITLDRDCHKKRMIVLAQIGYDIVISCSKMKNKKEELST
jgi:hypothetical protein